MANFQDRITHKGDLGILLQDVCKAYSLDDYVSHDVVEVGYEDFNVILHTQDQRYFIKIFAKFRSLSDCQRYLSIMLRVLAAGVQTAKLYSLSTGEYLYDITHDAAEIRLVVMEYIEGKTFFDLQQSPTIEELIVVTQQAAKINQLEFQPTYLYDGWSIVQCVKVFDENKAYLESEDRAVIESLIERYKTLNTASLPHCLVHGDLIATNVMKTKGNQLYLLDFAVANYYPRIIELAVILSGYDFGESKEELNQRRDRVIQAYEVEIPLTSIEKELIPLFTKLAYAMHVMGAAGQKAKGNESNENYEWLRLGRKGLKLMQENS